jgi:hypothetical protein
MQNAWISRPQIRASSGWCEQRIAAFGVAKALATGSRLRRSRSESECAGSGNQVIKDFVVRPGRYKNLEFVEHTLQIAMTIEQPCSHQPAGEQHSQSDTTEHRSSEPIDHVLTSAWDLRRAGSNSDPSWINELDILLTTYSPRTRPLRKADDTELFDPITPMLPSPVRFVRANRKNESS